jgi:hypothetical protein
VSDEKNFLPPLAFFEIVTKFISMLAPERFTTGGMQGPVHHIPRPERAAIQLNTYRIGVVKGTIDLQPFLTPPTTGLWRSKLKIMEHVSV